jgi:hypothetical protein
MPGTNEKLKALIKANKKTRKPTFLEERII